MMTADRPRLIKPPPHVPVPVAPIYCQTCGAKQFECSASSVIRTVCRKCKAWIVVAPRG